MKSSRIKITVAALAVALAGAVAVSQTVARSPMHGGGMFGEHMLGFYTDYLDLTDTQQAQAKDILAKEKTALQPLFQQMGQNHDALRQLEESGTFDETKVRALASQQAQSMTELIVAKSRMKAELFQILTPEQRTKMIKLADRHGHGFMKQMPGNPPDDNPNQ